MASFRKRGGTWYYRIYNENNEQVERKGFRDKRETERAASVEEERVREIKLGLSTRPDQERQREACRSLTQLIEEWREFATASGASPKHIEQTALRITRLCDLSGAANAKDLDPSRVQLALGKARTAFRNKTGQPLGPATLNHHLTALRIFCNWLVDSRRLSEDPTRGVKTQKASKDVRWQRRVLSPEEFQKLLAVASKSEKRIRNLDGPSRHWLYLLAATTGLRRSEIASLTVRSFDWTNKVVRVPGSKTKNGKEATQPIHSEIVETLKAWVGTRPKEGTIWGCELRSSRMIQEDLKVCGIPYRDEQGRVADFHSLRKYFATSLISGGANPKTAQTLMRHSTPILTMGVYAEADRSQVRTAVDNLALILPLNKRSDRVSESTSEQQSIDARALHADSEASETKNALGPFLGSKAMVREDNHKRRHPDSNRGITDLQSAALPLPKDALAAEKPCEEGDAVRCCPCPALVVAPCVEASDSDPLDWKNLSPEDRRALLDLARKMASEDG